MSSTSSQESAASASDSNELGCEPSRSARQIDTPAPSSPSIGLMSPAMTTCERSPPIVSEQMELLPTLSAEGSPARISARLELAQELKAREAVYGRNTLDLLASFDLATSSWRTSQFCLVEGLT